MTLLEYYLNPGTAAEASTTILGVTAWKAKFVSAAVAAAGSSTVTTETKLQFFNSLNSTNYGSLSGITTSTTTSAGAQQYPAGNGNSYFSPLEGNIIEQISGFINNSASADGNYISFAIEVDLDGDFDE